MKKVGILFCCAFLSCTSAIPLADDVVLNEPNEISGRMLESWHHDGMVGNAEEQGNYFEGDIILPPEGRNGVVEAAQKWKNAIVPYEITGSFSKKMWIILIKKLNFKIL